MSHHIFSEVIRREKAPYVGIVFNESELDLAGAKHLGIEVQKVGKKNEPSPT